MTGAAEAAAEYSLKRWGDEPQYRDARARDEGAYLAGHAHAFASPEVLALYKCVVKFELYLRTESELTGYSEESRLSNLRRCKEALAAHELASKGGT